MAARHGRNARVYLGATQNAAAAPLPLQANWSLSMTSDKEEVTAFGDANKQYVAGLPDASGEFGGFMDSATSQTYVAAADGLPRNFYLYWDQQNDPNSYFYGTILVDFSADGAVDGPVNFKASWNAASSIKRYTSWGGMGT